MTYPRARSLILTCAVLSLLSACMVVPVIDPDPNAELRFDICEDALERPAAHRAFQGLDGWFFFKYDLEPTYPLFEQTAFVAELSRRLETQGVQLVVLPVPSRAVVRPDTLHRNDPPQRAFTPAEAEAAYTAFSSTLQAEGVEVVNVLDAAKRFDRAGRQSFFKRDLHWTPEGAAAVAGAAASVVRRAAGGDLSNATLTLGRHPVTGEHSGQFVNRWVYASCGYALPPEPLGVYTVTRSGQGDDLFGGSAPEVVLAGSSFSLPPYDYEFLAVALQSEVLNASIGAGGALVALQSYLVDGAYEAARPKVLVWEFPVFADPIGEEAQRQLLASAYGVCEAPRATFGDLQASLTLTPQALTQTEAPRADTHYLALNFEDPAVLNPQVTLRYEGGFEETLNLERSTLTPNRGRYYLTLSDEAGGPLEGVRVRVPSRARGGATVQLCEAPA